jgi:hypothetical protein
VRIGPREDFAKFHLPCVLVSAFPLSFAFAFSLLRTTLAGVDVGYSLLNVHLGAFIDVDVDVTFVALRSLVTAAPHGIGVVSPHVLMLKRVQGAVS